MSLLARVIISVACALFIASASGLILGFSHLVLYLSAQAPATYGVAGFASVCASVAGLCIAYSIARDVLEREGN